MSGAADRKLAAIVLAGGAGTRVGGADKGLLAFRGVLLIEHALSALASVGIEHVVISANRNVDRYSRYGFRVVADASDAFDGPLAGIVAGMSVVDEDRVLTVPVDVPDWPCELPQKLAAAMDHQAGIDVAAAHDGEFRQPLFAMYRRTVSTAARDALKAGRRAVREFQDTLRCVDVRIGSPADYCNLNAPAQYA